MPDEPDERRLPAKPIGINVDGLAIEIAVEKTPERIVGNQETQHDDGTQRHAGAARTRQGPGEENRGERQAQDREQTSLVR